MQVFYFNQCFQNEINTENILTNEIDITEILSETEDKIYFINLLDEDFYKFFAKSCKPIIAAGGLVFNPKNELLLMYRRGFWDLPKGKWDEGETIQQCALREVQEETGLGQVSLQAPCANTYHLYQQGKKWMIKTTHWFTMLTAGHETLVPQTEEDIEQLCWVPKGELIDYSLKMHASLRGLVTPNPQRRLKERV